MNILSRTACASQYTPSKVMLQQTPRTSDIDSGEWSHLVPDAGEMALSRSRGWQRWSTWWSCKSTLCMRRSMCCSQQTSPSIPRGSAKRRWHPLLHAQLLHVRGRGDRERGPFLTRQSAVHAASRGQCGSARRRHPPDDDGKIGGPRFL